MAPLTELVLEPNRIKIASKIPFQSAAPRGLICFGSKYPLIFAGLLVPAKTVGTNGLLRAEVLCYFILGSLRLDEQMLAEQMNERMNERKTLL